ncbi:hypothetical protein M513_05928 [Trichuris suis]|nr:hypothetical protein M513_05928 [Trichuris suis]
MELLDPMEAMKNSPLFRWQLAQHELCLQSYEAKVLETLRCTTDMIEKGKAHLDSFKSFLGAFSELNKVCFNGDKPLLTAVQTSMAILTEVAKYQKVLVEQVYWSLRNLSEIRKRDLNKLDEMRTNFQRVGRSLDDALAKNAHSSKLKDHEGSEAKNELAAVGTCFAHISLDYVFQINWVHTSKKHEILEAFLSFIYATETFFHQGHDLFQSDWLNVKNELVGRLQSLKEDTRQLEKKMQDRHALVPKEVFLHPCGLSVDPEVVMEGYLFKRSSRAIRTWNRRWFIIKNNKLLYVRPEVDFNNQLFPVDISTGCTVMEDDLRLCLVRPAQSSCDRRYCFEVVTPSKSHMLQADSESLRLAWIKALKRTIEAALHDSMPDMPSNGSTGNLVKALPKDRTTSGTAVRNEVCNLPGNELCAECGSKDPKWASLNMGITLCIECSGIHRSLGVQVSKVRSITLDVWEPEQVQLMRLLGNRIVNNIYTTSDYERRLLRPNSPRFAREAVIKAKYLKRSFMRPFSHRGRLFRRHLINCACSRQTFLSPSNSFLNRYIHTSNSLPCLADCACGVSFGHGSVNPVNGSGPGLSSSRRFSRSEPSLCDGKDQIDVLRLVSDEMMCQSNELIVATARNDIPAMLTAIASGASVNRHTADGTQGTAFHQSKSAIACELLLLNGADINAQDGQRKTLLHYACEAGNTALVCFLVKRGADQGLVDVDGKCPLDIAIDQANADIVTLLRLAKLSDEFKD